MIDMLEPTSSDHNPHPEVKHRKQKFTVIDMPESTSSDQNPHPEVKQETKTHYE